ncbi:MAG: hypothetical protein OEX81_02600 [Candidatus Pacebacteria bacterium]|nr:hypothetical protein [Candidatus Paceibacterota bacterium]
MPKREIYIPASVLEKAPEENEFALLRFFVELFGQERAREILELLSDDPDLEKLQLASDLIFEQIRILFPYFRNLDQVQIEMIILEMYHKSNEIVEGLINTSYPDMEYEVGLLNTTSVPTVNLARRIHLMMSNGRSTSRFKYEILRQDVLAIMLMELSKYNHTVPNSESLHSLQQIFEHSLYEGLIGDTQPKDLFSIHDEESNECLGTFYSQDEANDFIKLNSLQEQVHIKSHKWSVRQVDTVGDVLANMRTKSDFSIIRKMIYNSTLDIEDRPKIRIGQDVDLLDTTGFMFVVPTGNRSIMMNRVLMMIGDQYPDAKFIGKSRVKSGRGQSNKVSFIRTLVYLSEDDTPVEIMVMDQVEYMNYRYELEQAHELFGLRKSRVSAQKLFPQEIYGYDQDIVGENRDKDVSAIRSKLLNHGRLTNI